MTPTLFLSHKSEDTALCRPLLAALEAGDGGIALRLGFDARDLRPGVDWRRQLLDWLRGCHGGVVVVTPAVLDQPGWVLQEATLMAYRAAGEGEGFRLFIVADDAVRADPRYTTFFGALAFDRLQQPRPAPGLAWHDDLPRIAQAVQAEMAKVVAFGDDYFARLAERLFDELAEVAALQAGRRLLDETFDAADGPLQALTDPPAMLGLLAAFRLAHADFGRRTDIEGLFQHLALVCARTLRHALWQKLQSWWVTPANALRVAGACAAGYRRQGPPGNLVLLPVDGRDKDPVAPASQTSLVVAHHVHRRFVAYGPWKPVLPLSASETLRDTLAALTEALRGADYCDLPDASLRMLVHDLARDRRLGKAPVLVHLHLGAAEAEHARVAARLFWPCTFVLTARPDHAGLVADALGLKPVVAPPGAPTYGDGLRLTRRAAQTDNLPGALA